MRFDTYHLCSEIDRQLRAWAEEYPDRFRLERIGTTYMGNGILAATVSDGNGAPEDKPAFLLTGGLHAGELAGSEAVMYALAQLLGPARALLKGRTVYAIPVINADGRSYYQETPHHNVRGSLRPFFNEEDGIYEADVDGDGLILTMRRQDPAGDKTVSPHDPRLMTTRRPGDQEGPFYRVWWEGFVRGEDTLAPRHAHPRCWLDPNRAFPFDWDAHAMGAYGRPVSGPEPLYETETRAVAEFVRRHSRNIVAANDVHTRAGLHISPLDFSPEHPAPPQDSILLHEIGADGAERSGYGREAIFPPGLTGMAKGCFTSWLYFEMGIAAWCTELYSSHVMVQGLEKMPADYHPLYAADQQRQQDELALLRWDDAQGGRYFVPWRRFHHPQLGDVELGGWKTKYIIDNPPPDYLEEHCRRCWDFTQSALLAMPRVRVAALRQQRRGADCLIEVLICNTGRQPTSGTAMARQKYSDTALFVSLSAEGEDLPVFSCELEGYDSRRFAWTVPYQAGKCYELLVSGPRTGQVRQAIRL